VAHGAAANIGLAHARHGDGRLDSRVDANFFQRILYRKRVHYGRQHAHIVAGCPVEALGSPGNSAEDIAAADDQAQLMACFLSRSYFSGHAGHRFRVDAELVRPHQRLARQLQQDAVEARSGHTVRILIIVQGGSALTARPPRCQLC
jgi:hypothetical protein